MFNSSSVADTPAAEEVWRLPFDVVSDVMAVSRPSTISALMKTCHALYEEGPKHLLADGVQLDSSGDVAGFANFMLVDDPSRFLHLRKLVLKIQFLPGCYQACLINILAHPSLALETLVVHSADALLRIPGVRENVCRLQTIKHLVALGVLKDSARVIQTIPSPLESSSISINVNLFNVNLPDIPSTLKPFSNTLHTLLINSESFLLALSLFQNAFPGIEQLHLIPTEPPLNMLAVGSSLHAVGSLRNPGPAQTQMGNREKASRNGTGPLETGSSLLTFDECSGGLHSVYALNLHCSLSTLRLWQPIQFVDLPVLRTVLKDTLPRRLCLITDLDTVPDLFATFQHQAPARLDLQMFMPVSDSRHHRVSRSQSKQGNVLSVLERQLLQRLPPLGLTEFSLHFHHSQLPTCDLERAFARWASTAVSPLSVSWRGSADEDLGRWPDLGQSLWDECDGSADFDYYDYMMDKGYLDYYL